MASEASAWVPNYPRLQDLRLVNPRWAGLSIAPLPPKETRTSCSTSEHGDKGVADREALLLVPLGASFPASGQDPLAYPLASSVGDSGLHGGAET